jgi:preprotein translocase subunit YajC
MLIDHAAFLAPTGAFMHPLFQPVLAQAADAPASSNPLAPLFMLVAMVGVFYFIVFRPQQKQQKELRTFVAALKKGDEVYTQGGLIGVVSLVEDQVVTLDTGGGNKIRVLKSSVGGAFKPTAAQAPKQEKK